MLNSQQLIEITPSNNRLNIEKIIQINIRLRKRCLFTTKCRFTDKRKIRFSPILPNSLRQSCTMAILTKK